MIVGANTSPLCHLVLIGNVDLLRALFGRVEIPEAVRVELSSVDAPRPVLEWIAAPPEWLTTHGPPREAAAELEQLHAGEREAIMCAERLRAGLVVLEDKAAKKIAIRTRIESYRHARHFGRGSGA